MDSPASKKIRLSESGLRPDISRNDTLRIIQSEWTSSSNTFENNGINIIHHPFTVCTVRNFVNNPELLHLVAEELKDVTFHKKNNDLYEFEQSDDVRNLTNYTFIPQLFDLIRWEGRKWVNDVIGGNHLKEDISATFSSYGYQDRLLCHDDKCEDRHIAFILYLVNNWREDEGGSLQLFDTDSNGYPSKIVQSINPEFNMMVFFEVTQQSFHQVSEVKSKTKKRLSLNGWFHSSGKNVDKTNCKILEIEQTTANDIEFNLEEYFLFTYFDSMNKTDIKNIFANQSEIQLDEFILPKFFKEIKTDLNSETLKWIPKGPANMRKYEIADKWTLPSSLKSLREIFQSKSWFQYLKTITGLDLSPSPTSDLKVWEKGHLPMCNVELQRWTNSCYTLIHDKDPEFHTEALDVILRIPFQEEENYREDEKNTPEAGHIIYIDSASRNEECLLHIGYKMNSLGLIFRDSKTLRFTKYLNSTCKPFYQVLCTYRPWKPPLDEPGLRHCEEDEETEDSVNEDDSS